MRLKFLCFVCVSSCIILTNDRVNWQTDSFGNAIQNFFNKKKKERTAKNNLQEVSAGVVTEGTKGASHVMSEAAVAQVDEDPEPPNADWSPMIPSPSQYVPDSPPSVPGTPKFQSSASCSLGESLFLTWKRMFASACDPMKDEKEPNMCAPVPKQRNDQNEAKERIARLVEEGWVVSADSCPKCNLLLFSMKGQTMVEMQRCALCGLITKQYGISKEDDDNDVNRIMEGWTINEGNQCQTSQLPTTLNPRTSRTHCFVDGVLLGLESTFDTVDPRLNDLEKNLKMLNASSLPHVTRFNAKELMKNYLKVEAESEYNCANTLPDPTPAMHALKAKKKESWGKFHPEPLGLYARTCSRHVSETHANNGGETSMGNNSPRVQFIDPVCDSENIHYASNGPTRASQAYGVKFNEPTPNLKAIHNKMFFSHSPYDHVMRSNRKKEHLATKAIDAPEHD
jgi:uncharacterized Zn finger protein (UPF0148 family)